MKKFVISLLVLLFICTIYYIITHNILESILKNTLCAMFAMIKYCFYYDLNL